VGNTPLSNILGTGLHLLSCSHENLMFVKVFTGQSSNYVFFTLSLDEFAPMLVIDINRVATLNCLSRIGYVLVILERCL